MCCESSTLTPLLRRFIWMFEFRCNLQYTFIIICIILQHVFISWSCCEVELYSETLSGIPCDRNDEGSTRWTHAAPCAPGLGTCTWADPIWVIMSRDRHPKNRHDWNWLKLIEHVISCHLCSSLCILPQHLHSSLSETHIHWVQQPHLHSTDHLWLLFWRRPGHCNGHAFSVSRISKIL